jgi:hypothetical protein
MANDGGIATLRQPIAVVKLDGGELPGVRHVSVTNGRQRSADKFSVELSLQAQGPAGGWERWSAITAQNEIEVLFGELDPTTGQRVVLQSAIIGAVDTVEVRQPENVVTVSGRDLSAQMIDTQSFESFLNQTASDVVTTIAKRRGLVPVVTPTALPIGRCLGGNTLHVTNRGTEWDLLTKIAENENFTVLVRGRSLIFQPATDPTVPPYVVVWAAPASPGLSPRSNVVRLTTHRQATLARNVVVTVLSFDPASGGVVTQTATSTLPGADPAKPQNYVIDVPCLSVQQASERAQKLAKDFSLFERAIDVELPGDATLTADARVVLQGTGTDWDQMYFLDKITREMSLERGFTMTIAAKNTSPAATVTPSSGATAAPTS